MLEKFLTQLSQEHDFPLLPPSKNQEWRYLQIGDIKLCFKQLDLGFFLSATILPLSSENQEKILTLTMKGNFMGQGTGGAVIGLTEDESFLTLGVSFPYEVSYKVFKESTEEFVNFLDFWKKTVAETAQEK